jgi:hypothetical protein
MTSFLAPGPRRSPAALLNIFRSGFPVGDHPVIPRVICDLRLLGRPELRLRGPDALSDPSRQSVDARLGVAPVVLCVPSSCS